MKVFKCNVCGNVVTLEYEGGGSLICCGQPMEELKAQTKDASQEKHVPFIVETEEGYLVKVGKEQEHPMTQEHYIVFIELTVDDKSYKAYLKPGMKPQAEFKVAKGTNVSAQEYCNLHGLWKS